MEHFARACGIGTALLFSIMATASAAEVLATAAAPVDIAAMPIRISLTRLAKRHGEPVALVLPVIEIRRGHATYNVFLAAARNGDPPRGAGDPNYIGTFGLFDRGPGSVVTLPVPMQLRARLGGAAPIVEIVPVGDAGSFLTLGQIRLLGP